MWKNPILIMVSFCLGMIGAWVIFRFGPFIGMMDRANHRSSHDGAVPKGGGIGILAAFVFTALMLKLPFFFWASISAVALFSFYGDKFDLSPRVRLPIQFLAAFFLLIFTLPSFSSIISDLQAKTSDFWFHISAPKLLSSAFCLFFVSTFIVGTANYYNFMDGINGIAGVTGVVAFGLIALYLIVFGGGDYTLLILSICVMASCIGFLPFNIPRARVFMGDVGAIMLGFLFGAIVVSLSRSVSDLLVFCSFLFTFYADELTTAFVRLRDGEHLFDPHRRHIYQLLANEKGIAHWKVSTGYGLLQIVVGTSIMALKNYGPLAVLIALAAYFTAFIIAGWYIRASIPYKSF